MIIPRDFSLPFVKKVQVTSDVYSFYFDRVKRGSVVAEESDLDFIPGQYVKMFLDLANPDERGNSRSFSIASSPFEKDHLMITTHVIQSTFKKTMLALTPGAQVKFFGPVGRFVFDENETKPHIFLAGGIGITPFRSMLLYASEKNINTPISLFVSFSKTEEMVFYDEISAIGSKHANIQAIYAVTHPQESSQKWQGETGRISRDMIKKYCPDFLESLFYISGPPAMVDAMLLLVKEMGVPDEQVRKEKFTGY